jgi:hypothetical protein
MIGIRCEQPWPDIADDEVDAWIAAAAAGGPMRGCGC